MGRRVIFNAFQCVIGLALDVTIDKSEILQRNKAKMVAIFSDSQTTIRLPQHLELGTGQRYMRQIIRSVQALVANVIATEIHWDPGNSSIPGNIDANHQQNLSRNPCGRMVIEQPYAPSYTRV